MRLKKGQNPLDVVRKIEASIARKRTALKRTTTALQKLEKQRSYYVKKAVEHGLS